MSDEKAREQARKDLSPAEDVKGAIRYLKGLNPGEEVQEFMEKATEVLDPRRSDIRAVLPEDEEEQEQDGGDFPEELKEEHERPLEDMTGQSGARQFVREHPQKK